MSALEIVADAPVGAAELVSKFIQTSSEFERSFLRLGKIRWELEQIIGGSAFSMLMTAGASKSAVSNAKYGAAAWARVQAGELTETEFERLTFDHCRLLDESTLRIERHPIREILRLKDEYELPDDMVIAVAKASCETTELESLVVVAKREKYTGAEFQGALAMRAAAIANNGGKKSDLPCRAVLEDARGQSTGSAGKANIGGMVFRLENELRKTNLAALPMTVLASLQEMLAPLKRQMIRLEKELHDRRGRSGRA